MSTENKSATIVAAIAVFSLVVGVSLTFGNELFSRKLSVDNNEVDAEENNRPVYFPASPPQPASDSQAFSSSIGDDVYRVQGLPRMALRCGGGEYRNGLLVFSPEDGSIFQASTVDEMKMTSTKIWMNNGIIRAILGSKYELIIDTNNPVSYKENSNYSPNSEIEERACFRAIAEAEYDCAEAANFRQCMSIRHPQQLGDKDYGGCRMRGARWQEFQCDIVEEGDYEDALEAVKSYEDYNF